MANEPKVAAFPTKGQQVGLEERACDHSLGGVGWTPSVLESSRGKEQIE